MNDVLIAKTPEKIRGVRLLTLKHALILETKGLHRRGESVYSIIKREFKLKGDKGNVLRQFQNRLKAEGIPHAESSLVTWLQGLKATDIQPVEVTIGSQKWYGARYTRELSYTVGMDAVTRGHKKAGDTYTEDSIYVVGVLPESYRPNARVSHVCFPFEGKDWFIAGYIQADKLSLTNLEYHPYGENFILNPWIVPDGEAIDKHASRPYTRIPLAVTKV